MPVVTALTLGVVKERGPITPEPVLKNTEVVPVITPAPVIVPVVNPDMVSTVPETLAPITTPPVAALAAKVRVPVAVIVLVKVTAVPEAAESVRLKLAPVETPLPVNA